jgi:hypothetical protein
MLLNSPFQEVISTDKTSFTYLASDVPPKEVVCSGTIIIIIIKFFTINVLTPQPIGPLEGGHRNVRDNALNNYPQI